MYPQLFTAPHGMYCKKATKWLIASTKVQFQNEASSPFHQFNTRLMGIISNFSQNLLIMLSCICFILLLLSLFLIKSNVFVPSLYLCAVMFKLSHIQPNANMICITGTYPLCISKDHTLQLFKQLATLHLCYLLCIAYVNVKIILLFIFQINPHHS